MWTITVFSKKISIRNIIWLLIVLTSPPLILWYISHLSEYSGDFISAGATISAALLAGLYVNQWKNQTKFNELLTRLLKLRQSLTEMNQEIDICRDREDVYFYCKNILENKTDSYFTKEKPVLDYSNIILKLNEIRDLFVQIKLIANSEEVDNHFFGKKDSTNLELSLRYNGIIKILCDFKFKKFNKINFSLEKLSNEEIEFIFLISNKLYSEFGWRENYKHLKPMDIFNEINSIHNELFNTIKKYRKWIDDNY